MNSSGPLNSLKPLAGRALETALNRLLALDPDTRSELMRLDGRSIQLSLAAPALTLRITVEGERLRVGPAPAGVEAAPDLAVRGTLAALLGQLPFLRDSGAGVGGRLHVSGDAELAQALQRLANGFAPDWNRPFAELFGEVPGEAIAQALGRALAAGTDSARRLARDAAEFFTEEWREVVGRTELEDFHDQVDGLRDHAERLAARAERLARRVAEREAGT